MPGISELSRGESYKLAGEQEASDSIDLVAETPPKDTDSNPRPNETSYGYVPEGPVSPEQLREAIAQVGLNVVAVRHAQVYPR